MPGPNAKGFASQRNIGFKLSFYCFSDIYIPIFPLYDFQVLNNISTGLQFLKL